MIGSLPVPCGILTRRSDGGKKELDVEAFLSLSTDDVAALVRDAGPKACVFPINGTRRWFLLEYPPEPGADVLGDYLAVIERRHIELYRLLFDHGIEYLLTPAFGPDLAERGDDYVEIVAKGLEGLATDAQFLDFYRDYEVRVRFYGDYRKYFASTPYAYLPDLFDALTARTLTNSRHHLFFGLFAQDASLFRRSVFLSALISSAHLICRWSPSARRIFISPSAHHRILQPDSCVRSCMITCMPGAAMQSIRHYNLTNGC
jgi:hypothetical protein